MRKITMAGLLSLIVTMQLTGCGGGGGASQTQQKTATITFGVMSTASLHSVPINGIRITAILPAGVTIPVMGTSNQIDPSALPLFKNRQAYGSYSASVRRVTIGVLDVSNSQTGIELGDFARLTCLVNAGATLSEKDFTGLNNPFPYLKVSGFDPNAAVNPVALTGTTKPTLTVTFGF